MPDNKELSLIDNLQASENSLWGLVSQYKTKFIALADETFRGFNTEKQDQFLMKTVISIVKNDNLKECFTTPEGKYSIFELIRNCVRTGLELDKLCYAVPQGRKIKRGTNEVWIKEARFDIRDRGYHAILCGGEKPIFKDLKWDLVYSKDMDEFNKFNDVLIKQGKEPKHFIDPITNEVNHIQAITEDRGTILGVWVQCTHLDNKKEAKFFTRKYIETCRDKSQTYKAWVEKKVNSCTWIEYEPQMFIKTAIKSFCKYWADISEALQNAYYSEKDNVDFDKQDIEKTAEFIIDEANKKFDEAERVQPDNKAEVKSDSKDDSKQVPPAEKKDTNLF